MPNLRGFAMSPIVSVILPTFNHLHYIETTIRTVCAQAFTNFELIIVDDGSSDETPVRLRAMVAADARLRYVRLQHGGAAAARNVGLDQARGRYVAFVDADDLLHPAYLYTLVTAAESSQADLVLCRAQPFDDGQPCDFAEPSSSAERAMDSRAALSALLRAEIEPKLYNRLYRRATLCDLRLRPDMQHENLEYSARLLIQAQTVLQIEQSLYGYRRNANRILTPKPRGANQDRIRVIRLIKQHLLAARLWPALKTDFQLLAVRHVGYYGFKDLIRAQPIDVALYQSLLQSLRDDAELGLGSFVQLPLERSLRKWVGLALLHPKLGQWFLGFQSARLHRRGAN